MFQRPLMVLIATCFFCNVLLCILIEFYEKNSLIISSILYVIIIGCIIPIITICLDYSIEISYPVNESITISLLHTSSHIFAILMVKLY